MRLTKKFLTALAPIAIVGVITPTVVSCGNNDYKINYGDDINCKDKKDKKTYQKVDKVKAAITNKINVETDRSKEISASDITGKIATESSVFQNIYYEFVYYNVNTYANDGFTLTGWSATMGTEARWVFTINGQKCENVIFKYTCEEEKIHFVGTGDDGYTINFLSHTYEHCKGIE